LRHVPASIAGAFTGVMPITAVLSAWIVLGEAIRWPHLEGMVLIVLGIVLVAHSRGRQVERTIALLRRQVVRR
jgi:drug/metabolite transporter (DMT)-like permease